jgi:hypothetical protein
MRRVWLGSIAVLALAGPAAADPVLCRGAIASESAKLAETAVRVVQRCRERVLLGRLPAVTDCAADPGLGAAVARARHGIAVRCCGADRACGTADDDALAAAGWTAAACPDLAGAGCQNAIGDADDVATCLACVDGAAAARTMALVYDDLVPAPAGSALSKCQLAIGRETARFAVAASKALARCWDARNRGRHTNPCPDPGDGRAAAAIAAAEAQRTARVCAACGGADRRCDGVADSTPAAIGFPPACPDLTPPGAATCAAPVGTLAELAACVGCAGAFGLGCADRLAVPAFAAYPATCAPPSPQCAAGVTCGADAECPTGYGCADNGTGTRWCVGPACAADAECRGGGVCRAYCTVDGCGPRQCQCPGFGCVGADVLCIESGSLACRKLCTQDSDCTDPFGFVCVNPGFGAGVCIGNTPCL